MQIVPPLSTFVRSLFLCCCLLSFLPGRSQTEPILISGTVTNGADSSALEGATVALSTNKKIATVTDASGKFGLKVPPGTSPVVLLVSFAGFDSKEINLPAGTTEISIPMSQGSKSALNEVVVTSLGISRSRKALGYSVTEVKGSEFTQARENNVANALTGKIAGVNAVGLSTGPGGSSRVTIRGTGSFGENQPLYVVNGMPIDNSVPGGAPTSNGSTSNVDRGDGIAGINPDDIESISVLKGGTAAALYGSRASNGVILITTKKGRAQKGTGVEYNTALTLDNVAVTPDFQYEYGQGDGGVKPTDLNAAIATGRRSFGAKIDRSTDYVGVDGKTHPYTAKKDNLRNFYKTGSTYTNTIALSGGNEKMTYRFSAADLNSKGILQNTSYDRKTFNLALNGRLSDKLSIDADAQYNEEIGKDRTGAGDALGNPNWTPLEIANTADVRWLKPGYDSAGNEILWNDAAIASNGYFVINKFQERDDKSRFIGQASITYRLLPDLVFKGTVARDAYSYNYSNVLPTGTAYEPLGEYSGIKQNLSETNSLVTGTYTVKPFKDFGISVLGGVNSRKFIDNTLNQSGQNFTIPFFYSYSNLATSSTTPYLGKTTTNSVFGSVDFNYNSFLFLSVTGREDWFSTLSPKNNHIFYPGIGGSFVLSDAVKLPEIFDLAKVRASWAQVGGGAPDPYAINLSYSNVPSAGQPLLDVTSSEISNPNLKPFTSSTYEAGVELAFFKNRLGMDLTVYDRKTTNDIVSTSISATSGYQSALLNVGEMDNRGIELLLTGSPVRSKNFSWNVSYNFAYNRNKVVELAPGLDQIQIAASVNNWATLQLIKGRPFGELYGTSEQKNAAGQVVFDANSGYPVVSDQHALGNSVAPYTMGLTNEFRYRSFSFSFLLDGKFGNKIFSLFEVYATRLGKLKSTLPGREGGLALSGVDQDGNKYTGTVASDNLRPYYDNYKTYSDKFVHDGSFIKLRQVIFSYNLPVSHWHIGTLQSASVSFVARNLFILYRQTKNFDPEQSFSNSNAQGFESIGLPRTRSYGLNLSVKF